MPVLASAHSVECTEYSPHILVVNKSTTLARRTDSFGAWFLVGDVKHRSAADLVRIEDGCMD
jgi:hypothetical protein